MDLETRYYLRRKMYCSAEFSVLELLRPLNNYVAVSLGMEKRNRGNRIEGNGIEGNGIEGGSNPNIDCCQVAGGGKNTF